MSLTAGVFQPTSVVKSRVSAFYKSGKGVQALLLRYTPPKGAHPNAEVGRDRMQVGGLDPISFQPRLAPKRSSILASARSNLVAPNSPLLGTAARVKLLWLQDSTHHDLLVESQIDAEAVDDLWGREEKDVKILAISGSARDEGVGGQVSAFRFLLAKGRIPALARPDVSDGVSLSATDCRQL